MEGPVAQLPPVPRLRLSRQPLASVADRNESRPQDDDDTQPTPIASEPADRLRALLARIPKPATRPMSPSDLDSDFEPPRFSPTQPKETLKDMFSRLLDDTPNKRTRRGSTSEVDDAPSEERTAKRKGKRKSLSDEEAELSKTTSRSSQATTYDTLRQKLNNSQTALLKQPTPSAFYDTSNADESGDTATFLRGLNPLTAVEPVATSTPPHSLEISQNSKFQTNLMDHDSEMNHFIKDLDSYEGDSGPSSRPLSFPSPQGRTPRPGTANADRKSYHGSTPLSRTRTHSGSDNPDHLHELERKWNQRQPKATDKSHTHGSPVVAVNGHVRVRTRSGGSIYSAGSGSSSRGTSTTSHSDHKEQMLELEKEKNYEREHDWNKSHPSRSNSSSSLHPATERTRKLSQPSRPGSSQSIRPPSALRRHSSVSASSSPETSDEEERIHHEIDHERERNWNAPKPKWGSHPHDPHGHQHHRSPSPLPSPAASTSRKERSRVDSLTVRGPPKADSSGHVLGRGSPIASSSKTNHNDTIRPSILKSPVASMSRPRPLSYPARPNSPLPPLQGPSKLPGPSSTHPPSPERERNRSRLPSSPSPVPSKRPAIAANRNSLSHIPVRSRSPTKTPGKAKTNGHSRTVVESPIDRRPVMQDVPQSDAESDKGVDEDDGTPVNPPAVLPVESSQRRSPSLRRTVANDEDVKFQQALSVAPPPSPPPSPPTPPPATEVVEPPTMLSLLSTPPKRPSFHNSKMDFKTPSPPRGLPDLPGPPSSSDEETETERVTPPRFADATMKTPRPPGAWSATPTSVIRASTLSPPPSDSDSQYEGGLATPGPSLSRASTLPTQTPRPPGGWVATPTPRKSVLQVRFDEKPSEVELSATEESANGHPEEQSEVSDTGLVTPVEEQGYFDSRTPEPVAPVSPKSPRRSPTINFVDEYGRHSKPTPKTSPKSTHRSSPKNRKKIRIVDAMGREVKPDASLKSEPAPDLPLTKANALNFVRNEVGDMASKLEEMDLSSDYADLERERIIQLDNESRTARAARHDLEEAYRRHSSAQLRASMLSSKLVSQSHSRSSSPRIWLWTIIIMFQALFIFLLYRYQARKTHELFLTTYYDPFYPDLHHIYGSKYDFFAIPRTVTSIRSLTRTLWEEGLRAFMGSLFETGTLVISEWQRDAWRRWGAEEISWPPT